jgi:hypothetical protein
MSAIPQLFHPGGASEVAAESTEYTVRMNDARIFRRFLDIVLRDWNR